MSVTLQLAAGWCQLAAATPSLALVIRRSISCECSLPRLPFYRCSALLAAAAGADAAALLSMPGVVCLAAPPTGTLKVCPRTADGSRFSTIDALSRERRHKLRRDAALRGQREKEPMLGPLAVRALSESSGCVAALAARFAHPRTQASRRASPQFTAPPNCLSFDTTDTRARCEHPPRAALHCASDSH